MLNNTIYQLKHNKKLRVAYFGGSITEGAGSSDHAKTCYRALTTAHLRESYPDAEITEIYAAIGGTGTSLGMFRLKKDVLEYKPDLIFMEFAVNDFGDTAERIILQTESIFRQIRKTVPLADIVALFSTSEEVIETLGKGDEFISREAQRTVAEHYGVPMIDHGEALRAHVLSTGEPYTNYAPDTLHPNDAGYRIMADRLISVLDNWLAEDAAALAEHTIPEKLDEKSKDAGDILYISDLCALKVNGFELKKEKCDRFDEYLEGSRTGDSFTFTFEGSGFGFFRVDGSQSADLLVSIDGAEPVKAGNWNHYVRSFERMGAAIVTKNLADGTHTVTVTADTDEQCVRIGGIFVC